MWKGIDEKSHREMLITCCCIEMRKLKEKTLPPEYLEEFLIGYEAILGWKWFTIDELEDIYMVLCNETELISEDAV